MLARLHQAQMALRQRQRRVARQGSPGPATPSGATARRSMLGMGLAADRLKITPAIRTSGAMAS